MNNINFASTHPNFHIPRKVIKMMRNMIVNLKHFIHEEVDGAESFSLDSSLFVI
jgi:hypothetical protein